MKTLKMSRALAFFLALVMLVSVFPLSVLAAERMPQPTERAYVSVKDPDTAFYEPHTLGVDGRTSNEKIAFVTYRVSELAGVSELPLYVTSTSGAMLRVYALEGDLVDPTLTYHNMPIAEESQYIGSFTPGVGNAVIDISGKSFSGEYVTFVIRARRIGDYAYSENFDGISPQSESTITGAYKGLHRDNEAPETVVDRVYSDKAISVRGGNISTHITKDTLSESEQDQAVYLKDPNKKAGRVKFYNAFKTAELNAYDIGRSFRVSFNVLSDVAKDVVKVGVIAPITGSEYQTDSYTLGAVGWTTLTYDIAIDEKMVTDRRGLLSVYKSSTSTALYIDDLSIVETTDPSDQVVDFDDFALQRGDDIGYNGQVSDVKVNRIYSSEQAVRRGGIGVLSIVLIPVIENGSFTHTTHESEETGLGHSMRMETSGTGDLVAKFFNLFKKNSGFTTEDIGRKYRFEFKILSDEAVKVCYGIRSYGAGAGTAENPTSSYQYGYHQGSSTGMAMQPNTWNTLSFEVTVDESMVKAQAGLPFVGFATGKSGSSIYIDSVTVTVLGEQAEIFHIHSFDKEIVKPEALKSEATDKQGAIYYRSCECGLIDTDESNVFEVICNHEYNISTATDDVGKYCKHCGILAEIPLDHAYTVRYSVDGNSWFFGDLATALEATGTSVIELYRDITLTEGITVSSDMTIRSCRDLMDDAPFGMTRDASFTSASMITVAGGNLTLENLTFDGASVKVASHGTLVKLNSGTATLGKGVTLINGVASNNDFFGGGVYIGLGTTLTVSGARIENCKARRGAGIYLHEGTAASFSTLVMTDGVITKCTYASSSSQGPAIFLDKYAVATITGGYIVDNTSVRTDKGGYLDSVVAADSAADGAIGIRYSTGVKLTIGGNVIFRNNLAKTLSTHTIVECDLGMYGDSNNYNNAKNNITIQPDFTGTIAIWYPGVTETENFGISKVGAGFTAGQILHGVIDASSGRVAKANAGGKLVWTDAVGQVYKDGVINRYLTLAEAQSAAGDAPVVLVGNGKAGFDAIGDSFRVAENGYALDFSGCPYSYSSAIGKEMLGDFYVGNTYYSGKEYDVTTYRAETLGAITYVGLTLGTDLTLKIYAALPDAMKDAKILVTRGAQQVLLSNVGLTINGYEYRYHLNSQCIGDSITLKLFQDANENQELDEGELLHSMENYSAKEYCTDILSMKPSELDMTERKKAALDILVRDLLVYGGAAQTFAGYRTESLVSDGIEGSDFPGATDNMQLDVISKENARFTAATTRFSHAHELIFKFATSNASLTTVTIDGVEYTENDFTEVEPGVYSITSDAIYAKELIKQFKVCLFYDGEKCANLLYGFGDYAAHMTSGEATEKMVALAKATYNYGFSAQQYAATDPVKDLTNGTFSATKGKLLGSAAESADGVALLGSASGVEFRIYGKGEELTLHFKASAGDRVGISLDELTVDHIALAEGETSYTLKKKYDEDYHTVRVIAESGEPILTGITLPFGYTVAPNEASSLYIEYVGGGAMAGETLFEESGCDASGSYAYLSAKELGADYRIVNASTYEAGTRIPQLVILETMSDSEALRNAITAAYGNVTLLTVGESDADIILTEDSLKGIDGLPSLGGSAIWAADLAAFIKEEHSDLIPLGVVNDGRNMIVEFQTANATTGYQPFYIYTRTSDVSGDYYVRYHFAYKYSDVRNNYGTNSASNLNLYRVDSAQLVKVTGMTEAGVSATVVTELLTSGEISLAVKEKNATGEAKADFVGGYHGDEWMDAEALKLTIDGNVVSPKDGNARAIACHSVILDQTSTVYAHGTSNADSHGDELLEHIQHFTMTATVGILNRQSLTWKGGHQLNGGQIYVQMFTMRRLYNGNKVCEQIATYDGEGKQLAYRSITDEVSKQYSDCIHHENRTLHYSSATSGISAECGYTMLEGVKQGTPYVAVRDDSIGDNKWYVSGASTTTTDFITVEDEKWVIDCAYKINYVK